MKKVISLMLLFVFVVSMRADNYKILWMNTSAIKIGNKICRKGSTFSDRSIVAWKRPGQAIKAQNLRTKEIDLFVEPAFKMHKSKSILEYYIRTNHMSTREVPPTPEELKCSKRLNSMFYMLDEIHIRCIVPKDNNTYYYIRYEQNGKIHEKKLLTDKDGFVIPRSLLEVGDAGKSMELIVSVYFKESTGEDLLITDSMKIQLLPLKIDK